MSDKKRLIKTVQELIRINSENPPGDERRIAVCVKDYLKKLGLEVKIYEFGRKRPNVLAVLKGRQGRHALLLTPHLDTVPAGKSWTFPPFAAQIKNNRIYGLGATDCKGNLAAGLEAIKSLVEERIVLDYNLIFAATADEESGSGLGLIPLLKKRILRPDAALVLDADDFSIIVAQKGLAHIKIKIQGKKAHGAYPHLGVNAIDIAVKIISALKAHKFSYQRHKHLKPPTLNVGTIHGGDKVNVVADWCEFELDLRFLPGSQARQLLKVIKSTAAKFAQKFSIEIEGIQQPYTIDKAHPLVKYLAAAARRVGVRPSIRGSEGATVITFFQEQHIPAVATGFGVEKCAHIADEYAKIDNLYKGAKMLEEFLKIYEFDK